MANFFKIEHSDNTSTIINCDNVNNLKLENNKVIFNFIHNNLEITYKDEQGAKNLFEKIFARSSENLYYDNDNDDDEDDDNYKKPDKEKILSERIDQLLDLLNEKEKEIKALKNEKKGFLNKIKGLVQ